MPLEDRGEGEVGGLGLAGCEPFEELTVGKVADCPQMEEGRKVAGGQFLADIHAAASCSGSCCRRS